MPHPLIIIGLDGATFDLLDPLIAAGQLPTLARLASTGLRTELLSTLPAATLPAWSSFLTAANPGRHGVVDIFAHRRDYALHPTNAGWRGEPTFLARLSARGASVASLGVPGTYPPEPVNGIAIAGFDAPGASRAAERAFWPPQLHDEVDWRYSVFNEHRGAAGREAAAALLEDIAQKEAVILDLYRRRPWDLFFVHLQASDTAAHHLWHTWDRRSPRAPDSAELADALPSIYRRLDTLIGRLLSFAPTEARVLVVSDHGMGGAGTTAVHLNRWLHARGLLSFRAAWRARSAAAHLVRRALGQLPPSLLGALVRATPARLAAPLTDLARGRAIHFTRSAAFSDELDYAPSIWLNRRGAFPAGFLDDREADALAERIQSDLRELRDGDGAPLVRAVHRREQVMRGPFVERAPDLIIEPAWPNGYRASFLTSAGPGPAVRRLARHEHAAPKGSGMPGVHRREGVLLAAGAGLPAGEIPSLEIAQAGALVYRLAGYAVPDDVEARLPAYLEALLPPATRQAAPSVPVSMAAAYSAAEEAAVTRRLRSLGYID